MAGEGDRRARAGDYVLGLMKDAERQRAERDLEIDPAFRDAVIRLAERMHIFDRAVPSGGDDRWRLISQRIAELPQMRAAGLDDVKPVIHGLARKPHGFGVHSLGARCGMIIAAALIAVFVFGYLMGRL
ncbi:hypothetical protein FJ934_10960 [Mesorhizobium sp. B2-4-12]|uniref:hypothetical protein n=1 Tax=Mesorhizobium sp. B2-4-12 TaxID=2589937 RepID=UPI00112AFB2F|nr:hypothetical protein [Mesorhizobium sp. B2-4-12]TPK95737.1 hypothetical protein FJ934_10960 [Mesorhizobium sp. B2-4-12]